MPNRIIEGMNNSLAQARAEMKEYQERGLPPGVILCKTCGREIDMDKEKFFCLASWVHPKEMLGNYCKECAIKLPGHYGVQARGYFDVDNIMKSINR